MVSERIGRVVALHRALHSGAWVRFFRLAAALPYLPACLCHAFFGPARAQALHTLLASGAHFSAMPLHPHFTFPQLLRRVLLPGKYQSPVVAQALSPIQSRVGHVGQSSQQWLS